MTDPSETSPASAPATEYRVRVLLVDDQLMIVEAVRRVLAPHPDIEFHYVTDPPAAVDAAAQLAPTVILQDLVMPMTDGFALVRAYRAHPLLAQVPVVVLSVRDAPHLKAHAFTVGANDYLVKLPDALELVARVRYHSAAHISRLQRDEAFRFLRESQQSLAEANIELHKLAALDGLTGVANRRRFDAVLHQEWQRGQRERKPLALLMCDVDYFKPYNDQLGHVAGDLALKKVAAVLTENLKRPADLAARYGGEEFAVILPETDAAGAAVVAESCRAHLAALALPHPGNPADGTVTMSIGVACTVPGPSASPEQLVELADRALYTAKSGGRNRVHAPGS
jgi:two-component system chemotaxis family response regulator WspR